MTTKELIAKHEKIINRTLEQRNTLKEALVLAHRLFVAIREDNLIDCDGQEYVEPWHMEIIEKALKVY